MDSILVSTSKVPKSSEARAKWHAEIIIYNNKCHFRQTQCMVHSKTVIEHKVKSCTIMQLVNIGSIFKIQVVGGWMNPSVVLLKISQIKKLIFM